ncbi:hypothetical protein D9Q81_05235 [Candidatus Korarchaeum cryptofilum]|uniref:Bacterial repeat domain-containing protein n=1 Tax=Candidatus Korarchaeum cryptofilum TaxID=498846 RepID=A0A3R9QYP0_9CREN|nr:hypothetical protein [Candidatus Korarchaeum cryptofilum]RSN68724.1 hypothetical protein D9Q81_05235 [Candidatus Korarchaeum cryptofilum]
MRRKELLILLVLLIVVQAASAEDLKVWASKGSVGAGEEIELNILWGDTGCKEYHVVIYRTYPSGEVVRYPAEGYGDPLKAPGPMGIRRTFSADRAGIHTFRVELYCGTTLLAKGDVKVNVTKGASQIYLNASPRKVRVGEEITLFGSMKPERANLSLEVVSPDGARRNLTLIVENGNFSRSLLLNVSGTWRFRALWSGNKDFSGSSSDWIDVEVAKGPLKVSVRTDPPGLTVYVDGKAYPGGGDFEWEEGSIHSLSADAQRTEDGRRYIFRGWRGMSNSTSISVRAEPSSYVAEYRVQYYLNVTSELGEAEGSGWYDAGSYARAKLKTDKIEEFPWIYVFKGWGGDANGSSLISDPILMDKPKVALAKWERTLNPLYMITILSISLAVIFGLTTFYLLLKYRRKKKPSDERVKRIREKISKLEEMRRRGEIPEGVYVKLKREYMMELRRIRGKEKG